MGDSANGESHVALLQVYAALQAETGSAETADTLERHEALHRRVREAYLSLSIHSRADMEHLQQTRKAAEDRIRELESDVQRLQRGRPTTSTASGSITSKSPFVAFSLQLSELRSQLLLSRTVFKGIKAKSREDLRDMKVCAADLRFCEPAVWRTKERFLVKSLADLQARVGSLTVPIALDAEEALLEEVQQLASSTAAHVRAAEDMRQSRDAQLAVFFAQCEKLTVWCRQQLVNLDAMEEPDHIQEYCAALVENYATMSRNFSVLLESVKEHVRANNVSVRRALLEADELWFYLQISTLERLSATLYEVHPVSPLENEVTTYSGYSTRVGAFIQGVQSFLSTEAVSVDGAAVLSECEELSSVMLGYADMTAQMSSFAARARLSRASYQCLRDAVLARLTFIAPASDSVMASKRRQDEFESCARELKQWASNTARGDSWRDIYSKIVEIKRMIKQEQQTLDARS